MGALVVNNGVTVTLSPGQEYDYSSITVNGGGILQIDAGSANWGIIGCAGAFINNGTIRYIYFDNGGASGSIQTTRPNVTTPTWSFTQAAGGGGAWGNDYYGAPSIPGGAGAYGNGGGGGADGYGGEAGQPSRGGNGGYSQIFGPTALGAAIYGNAGGNANPAYPDGGAGGSRGYSGGPIYVKIKGNYSGSGIWNVSGSNGGAGGNAGQTTSTIDPGGGGGGAGGSAGWVYILVRGTNTFAGTYPTTGGNFGTGGGGGLGGGSGPNIGGSGGNGAGATATFVGVW